MKTPPNLSQEVWILSVPSIAEQIHGLMNLRMGVDYHSFWSVEGHEIPKNVVKSALIDCHVPCYLKEIVAIQWYLFVLVGFLLVYQ